MRIATSTLYEQQAAAIDNLVATQQQYGQILSTGKQLNVPSDDPTQIAQDLSLRTTLAQDNQTSRNLQSSTAELTTVDGALSTLSDVMQKARAIAVQGASDTVNPAQQQVLAAQVDSLLNEAIGIANTQYAGKYVFAGTADPSSPPVQPGGQPVSSVVFSGNLSSQSQQFVDGQSIQTSVTLQQAFNYASPNGSPDVFATLITLRDTLAKGTVVDESSTAVNRVGQVVAPTTTVAQLSAGAATQVMATPLTPDSSGNVSIAIASAQQPGGVRITFLPTDSVATIVAKINASGAGVTAAFDPRTERLSLTAAQPFQVSDTPSPGASNSANFVKAFNLAPQADLVNNLSRQIGDIDGALQGVVNARARVGGSIQALGDLSGSIDSQVVNTTTVESGIEDADIAKVISRFSQTQTALQAAYGTTTRLESKTLFDYLQ